ncbi:hypothetical protein [Myceligenerans pegani]|uniref:Uncharacterized protein n=1 Tax=Myceligenerans pegani TaxID=2776917 RepID=A0ABR9MX60_9MICO|nr:hypothetical protein [Myceligenerans sp. TRM 65318]MBE1875438.1 hypothetical protein [Myceligenerans sp. TRM 65318]MBE3017709.1 hypothetical protein [Myceligenerans sp. TRM 65318]
MTTLSDFGDDEITQLLDTPGAVLRAASLVDGRPSPVGLLKASARAAKVFREAQRDENEFVRTVALALRDHKKAEQEEKGDEPEGANDFLDPDSAGEAARAVELAESSIDLLRGRVDDADVDAYGTWLIRIATQVAEVMAAKEGNLFSRRAALSDNAQNLIDRLTKAASR